MTRGFWLLVSALIAAVLIPLLLGGTGLLGRLLDFPLDLLALMLGMILVCWNINAIRLRLLLRRLHRTTHLRALGIVMASEFAFCATPGGAGGPLTLMALLARRGVRPAQATAVFAVDQLSDLLFFVFALIGILIYAVFHALSPHVGWLLGGSAALLTGVIIVVLGVARYHRTVLRTNGRLLRLLGMEPLKRLHWGRKVLRFRNALQDSLRMPKTVLVSVFLLSSLHWLLRNSILYMTLIGLGSTIPWAWTFLVQMLAMTAGQASLLPGGAGSAELASGALLTPMVGTATAGAAILIWRFVTYYFYLIAGAPVFIHLAGRPLLKRLIRFRRPQP
ncbi:uncharacterized protein (TIRG00374 family) [Pseudomonas duriflava]|uniref:Uncharacterized protein (TIRG00374 family) n=1 Tax=Pseudomonas duriflava TaxID=459528 RepID=A0A562QQR2_9PSED|nr:lysylphosphatidylglycerol synthase transmembrane domain-containing protein [Pseudomonas duriflava]TWI58540.1 uncharacterized protein (TIRG00374 family) [Pseudomonas duriflava]